MIAAAPDVILKMNNGNIVGAARTIFRVAGFQARATPAGARAAHDGMDGLYLLGFGPRTPNAVRELMADLYPNLTLPPLPTLADRQ